MHKNVDDDKVDAMCILPQCKKKRWIYVPLNHPIFLEPRQILVAALEVKYRGSNVLMSKSTVSLPAHTADLE